MSTTLTAAARQILLNTPNVLGQLPGGANGIIVAGNLALGRIPDSVGLPCIAIQDSGTPVGSTKTLPFEQNVFHVRVYDNAVAPNNISYARITPLLEEIVHALGRVTYTANFSYAVLFEVWYDNYKSPELFDEYLKLPFRFARFRAYSVRNDYEPH